MPGARTAATVVLVACATTFMARLATAGAAGQEPRPAAGQPVAMLRTWAVLASEELRKSGLEDQVLVGLGADKTMTLVDRQQIKVVFQERALAEMFPAEAAGRRRDIGRVLKADALLLLSAETVEGREFIRLVICDTQAGARLRTDGLAWSPDRIGDAAEEVAARVRQVRKHFAHGVERVYGVPPFVCRNLEYTYNHLQSGYANLLGNALASQPGVAVIETEEARQIARELALAGGEVARMMPKFVEGEYEVVRAEDGGEPSVQLTLKVTGGGGRSETIRENLKLSAAPEFLRVDVAARVSGQTRGEVEQALTVEEQFAALAARADAFAMLGSWQISTGMREAALLIKDDPSQRTRLLDEYHRMIFAPLPNGLNPYQRKSDRTEACRQACAYRWVSWQVAVEHLQYLVCNGQVTTDWAVRRISRLFSIDSIGHNIGFGAEEDLVRAENTKKRFARQCTGAILQLKTANGLVSPLKWGVYIDLFNSRIDHKPWDKEDLDFIFDMTNNIFPEDVYYDQWVPLPNQSRIHIGYTREQYLDFCDRLEASERPISRLRGRSARLWWRWFERDRSSPPAEVFLTQAEALVKEWERVFMHGSFWYYCSRNLCQEIKVSLAPPKPKPKPDSTPHVETDKPKPAPEQFVIAYEEIPLQLKDLTGQVRPWESGTNYKRNWWGMKLLNCGDSMDVFWDAGVVLFHRQKGLLEEVLVEPDAGFGDVQWDGRNLWVGACSGSVRVLLEDGKEVARVDVDHGLPPCDRAIRLMPIAPGKILAVGCFEPMGRAWCAMIELKDGKPVVNAFHRAIRIKSYDEEEKAADADYAFFPLGLYAYPRPGERPLIVVKRHGPRGERLSQPLVIDPDTLEVSVSEAMLSAVARYYFADNGKVLELSSQGIWAYPALSATRHISNENPLAYVPSFNPYSNLIFWKGRVYAMGQPWCRIDPTTMAVEYLAAPRLLLGGRSAKCGISAHYGLVVWGLRIEGFYRVVVNEEAATQEPSAATGPDKDSVKPPASAASNR